MHPERPLVDGEAALRQRRLLRVLHERRHRVESHGQRHAEIEARRDRAVAAVERRVRRRQEPAGRVLRPSLRQLRADRLQRHHAGNDQESAFGRSADQLSADHDVLDAEPHPGDQPAPSGIPWRLHVGRGQSSRLRPEGRAHRLGRHPPPLRDGARRGRLLRPRPGR